MAPKSRTFTEQIHRPMALLPARTGGIERRVVPPSANSLANSFSDTSRHSSLKSQMQADRLRLDGVTVCPTLDARPVNSPRASHGQRTSTLSLCPGNLLRKVQIRNPRLKPRPTIMVLLFAVHVQNQPQDYGLRPCFFSSQTRCASLSHSKRVSEAHCRAAAKISSLPAAAGTAQTHCANHQ